MKADLSNPSGSGRGSDGGEGACAYCEAPLTGASVLQRPIAGQAKTFCGPGCAFIAEQIAIAQARLAGGPDRADRSALPHLEQEAPLARAQLQIAGLACEACAAWLEQRLKSIDGVASAHVDYSRRCAWLLYDAARITPTDLHQAVARSGYRVVSVDGADADAERRALRREWLRVGLGWVLALQVLLLALPGHLAHFDWVGAQLPPWLRLAQLVLTLPMALLIARPLWRASLSQGRTGRIGMELCGLSSLCAALILSCTAVALGRGDVYFDLAAMLVALLLTVRAWQQHALRPREAQRDALHRDLGPAHRLLDARSGRSEIVAVERLKSGDCVLVAPGDRVPADGRVVEGRSVLSQEELTGATGIRPVEPGSWITAGTINLQQALVLEVSADPEQGRRAAMQRLFVAAAAQRPRRPDATERWARRSLIGMWTAALLTGLVWLLVDPSVALKQSLGVLIAVSPCALALCGPLVYGLASVSLRRRGILVTRPAALEEVVLADTAALDKAAVLTRPEPELTGLLTMRHEDEEECLRIAASLSVSSPHPLAQALLRSARRGQLAPMPVHGLTEQPGAGIEGVLAGRRWRLGRARYALGLAQMTEPSLVLGATLAERRAASSQGLMLADQDGPAAILRFGDKPRVGAARVLMRLAQQARELHLLAAEPRAALEEAVSAVEKSMSSPLKFELHAELTASDKQGLLARWQERGRRVLWVAGPGADDVPAMAQADVSVSVIGGRGPAGAYADIVCLKASDGDLDAVLEAAHDTRHVMNINLAWAQACGAVMALFAMGGMLPSGLALAGAAASAALVTANSLRLAGRRG